MDFRFVTRNSDFFAPSDKVYPRLRLGELAPVLRRACAFGRGYTPADISKMPLGSPRKNRGTYCAGHTGYPCHPRNTRLLMRWDGQTIRIRDS